MQLLDAAPAAEPRGAGYRGIVATSFVMRQLFAALKRLESSLVSVLVLGESGAGKELVARALHAGSSRKTGPFVAKNCGAMTRELVASELFGHRRGAFTGAIESRAGAFEAAHGGTLFLDEIGELPIEVQPMLLRALESGEITPLGANEPRKVDVRLVTATHRDLPALIRAGQFRRDLYHRVAVVSLRVPALRDRPDDIPLLASHFAERCGIPPLPDDLLGRFAAHAWPGNVRELKNAVEAFAALGSPPELDPAELDVMDPTLRSAIDFDRPLQTQRAELLHRFTRSYLELLLRRVGGNQSEAARVAGTERSHFRKLLAAHGLLAR